MNCEEFRSQLNFEMNSQEVENHLENCDSCSNWLNLQIRQPLGEIANLRLEPAPVFDLEKTLPERKPTFFEAFKVFLTFGLAFALILVLFIKTHEPDFPKSKTDTKSVQYSFIDWETDTPIQFMDTGSLSAGPVEFVDKSDYSFIDKSDKFTFLEEEEETI